MKESNVTELVFRPKTDNDYIHAAHMMEQMGGGFASCIARAYYKADMSNRARLRAAFPELFTEFFTAYLTMHPNQEGETQ